MVILTENDNAISNVTKLVEGTEDYVLIHCEDELEPRKLSIHQIKSLHPEY